MNEDQNARKKWEVNWLETFIFCIINDAFLDF